MSREQTSPTSQNQRALSSSSLSSKLVECRVGKLKALDLGSSLDDLCPDLNKLRFHRNITCKHLSSFVSKLLDSDGLDDSREAEEESKLTSVRNHSIGARVVCQT